MEMNAMNYRNQTGIWEIGSFVLDDKVDITDPCYDKDVWCRMTMECEPGEYYGHIKVKDDGEYGNRVEYIAIYKDNEIDEEMEYIGGIGVDAGCAGFFNNKPDYNDNEWHVFVEEMNPNENNVYVLPYGIFSESGYGDGGYNVYANEKRNAFKIVFIEE